MTDARVAQEVVQVLHGGETSNANVSQEVIQVLHGGNTSDARISQQVLQVLYKSPEPDARVTQEPVLVLHGGAVSDVRVTQEPVLVLHGGLDSQARVTQEAILVLHTVYVSPLHPCQEDIAPYIPVAEQEVLKISQAPLQVLITEATSHPPILVSQAPIQVLVNLPTGADIHISQAPIQVLLSGTVGTQYEEVRVSQAPIQVLTRKVPSICFILCEDEDTRPTGTFEYTILYGNDVATAIFMQAGTVFVFEGEACIDVEFGNVGDDVIIVLQMGDLLGAYEGVLI